MANQNIVSMKALLEAGFSNAFGAPVSLIMRIEGDRAQSSVGGTARRVIEESYDVFGRDKIDLTN